MIMVIDRGLRFRSKVTSELMRAGLMKELSSYTFLPNDFGRVPVSKLPSKTPMW